MIPSDNSIIPKRDGFEVANRSTALFFPKPEMDLYGCRNCVWKIHGQCPYGLKDDEAYPKDVMNFKKKIVPDSTISSQKDAESFADSALKDVFSEIAKSEGIILMKDSDISNPIEIMVSEENFAEGICPEMLQFLTSLAPGGSDLHIIHERFLIYKSRLQEAADYKDYMELQEKVTAMEKQLHIDYDVANNEVKLPVLQPEAMEALEKLQADRNSSKLWWVKLHQFAIFALQKVNDREAKGKDAGKLPGIYARNVNFFSAKPLIEDKGGK